MAQKLRVIPLGGLGEIGKNMMVLETNEDLILIDCGVMFPEEEMLGVDLVIPDVTYVQERIRKLRGILITHGHEDHVGALPYILPALRLPNGKLPTVYTPPLAEGLIRVKLEEHKLIKKANLKIVEAGDTIKFGNMSAEWIHITHSIPDSTSIAVRTPVGTVFHTGDFKFDHTPVMGAAPDLSRIAEYGSEGVLLLLSDSTYADTPGYTSSEMSIADTLDRVMANAEGRVIVATFASLISRVQQVIDAAEMNGRQVFVTGRSMMQNVRMALENGYLVAEGDPLQPLERMKKLRPEKIAIVTTGAQGEPSSALVRMANRDHRHIDIQEGDTVIFSSSAIPGNEQLINHTIDNLYRLGAHVLFSKIAKVHVSGHGAQEELKLMLSLTKPVYFVPVHGEYRHLVMHSAIAQAMGIPPDNIFTMEDGEVLEIDRRGARITERIPSDFVYVDGLAVGVDQVVLRDRRHLSGDGVFVAIVSIDRHTGKPIGRPDVVSRGFIESDMSDALMDKARDVIEEALAGHEHAATRADINARVHDSLSRFLYQETRRRPMILPVSLEI
jgi:ribonuclease J